MLPSLLISCASNVIQKNNCIRFYNKKNKQVDIAWNFGNFFCFQFACAINILLFFCVLIFNTRFSCLICQWDLLAWLLLRSIGCALRTSTILLSCLPMLSNVVLVVAAATACFWWKISLWAFFSYLLPTFALCQKIQCMKRQPSPPLLAVALFVFLPFVLLFFFINVLLYILRFLKQTQQASQQPANRSPTARHSFVSRQSCLKGSRFFPSLFCRKRKKTQSIRKSTTILLASSSLLSKEEQGEPPPRQFGHHKAFWR